MPFGQARLCLPLRGTRVAHTSSGPCVHFQVFVLTNRSLDSTLCCSRQPAPGNPKYRLLGTARPVSGIGNHEVIAGCNPRRNVCGDTLNEIGKLKDEKVRAWRDNLVVLITTLPTLSPLIPVNASQRPGSHAAESAWWRRRPPGTRQTRRPHQVADKNPSSSPVDVLRLK